jgi:signal transduction histidine kinase
MNLAHGRKSEQIAQRARFLARELRPVYPMVDERIVELAARFRKSRFDHSLERKSRLTDAEYRKAIACFRDSGEYAAELLITSLGEEGANRVRRVIDDHLEHYDGSGPQGKSAEDVLPEAYILNMSCAIQNMLDRRPNRHGTDDGDSALESFIELAGSQYPPRLVSKSFEALKRLLEAGQPVAETMRMAELGRAASGVFHDISNYLQVITAALSCIKEDLKGREHSEEIMQFCDDGIEAAERMDFFKSEMLDFARGGATRSVGNINLTMDNALKLVQHTLKQVTVRKEYGDIHPMLYFTTEMKHVFANLLKNAGEAIRSEGGVITVRTCMGEDQVVVSISDNGEGMGAEQLDSIFSGRSTRLMGHGIGTQFCRYIVEKHGGSISYVSEKGVGTTVSVRIPQVIPFPVNREGHD